MTNENRRYLSFWYLRINNVFPESVSMSRRRGWIIVDGIDVNIEEQNCTMNVPMNLTLIIIDRVIELNFIFTINVNKNNTIMFNLYDFKNFKIYLLTFKI